MARYESVTFLWRAEKPSAMALSRPTAELVIDTFDPRRIGQNRVVVFIGKRGAGKTFLMEDICYFLRNIPEAVIWSATEEGNETWGRHFPGIYIHSRYDADKLAAIYQRQRKKARQRRREAAHGVPPERCTRVTPILVIIEDQAFQKSIFRCPTLAEVLMNGRHYGMTVFITTQYSRSIGPDLRSQFDFVFCCLEKMVQNRRRLYEDYFGVFPDFNSFDQVMMQCTSNFGCLVMDNTSRTCDVRKSVFYYRARDRGDYKFGSPAYWLYHYMHYQDEEENDESHEPLLRLRSRPTIRTHVRKGG